MKLDDLQPGDVVLLDDGFDCMPAGRATVQADGDGRLYLPCSEGSHFLDGQLRDDGGLSGVFWPGEIEAQAAFRAHIEALGVPAPWRPDPSNAGTAVAGSGAEAVTADTNNQLPDVEATAIAAIAAMAVNRLAGWPDDAFPEVPS